MNTVSVLDEQDQRRLLVLARRALEARVRRQPSPEPARGGTLDAPWSAFVTIHNRGELRGCLGRLDTQAPLGETIAQLAASVSDSDPRFFPVSFLELPDIDIEISVLTPEREIRSIEEIEIGRHGLIVELGANRGLLLPQVATEQRWNRDTFVSQACLKAWLPHDAWREGARLFVFEAQVFGELDFAGRAGAAGAGLV
ncbi:MAG: AmmeMemoRadiSam system protein A [Acidobacteria bacterium]|nr:AmmeMemoRadiSam system protein A [Acidobacteriota bacterium]